ncbi:MAG: hypothetical protein E3K37_13285 [Candidatus Kuenenia sp.]|nr:hypothetical protein [Candidatus Kuenenia hertensis]
MIIERGLLATIFMTAAIGFSGFANAFETEIGEEQIAEAVSYGKKYKGAKVFKSGVVKAACFGKYPESDGGLVMSKYVELAIVSAMNSKKEKETTSDAIKEIQSAKSFKVIVLVSEKGIQTPGEVQITIKQGMSNILPQKTEFGRKYKDNKQSIVGVFWYDKIDTDAKTAIIVKTKEQERKYKIDFSDIK